MPERSKDAKPSAEYSGRTVPEALARASAELGVPPGELQYEVVRDSHSFLGLVRTGEAVVRVWLPERRADRPGPTKRGPRPAKPEREARAPEAKEQAPSLAEPAPAPRPEAPPADRDREEDDEPSVAAEGNLPELCEVASEVLSTLVDKMGIIAAVEVADAGGKPDPISGEVTPLVLNIVGDDLGVLIGRRGETLRDLQFVARLLVSRRIRTWPNLVVDVEGYKARRVAALQALARRMADQVRESGRAVALEPMPAHERRIIHLALREDPDVYTESVGEDEARKVQILPK